MALSRCPTRAELSATSETENAELIKLLKKHIEQQNKQIEQHNEIIELIKHVAEEASIAEMRQCQLRGEAPDASRMKSNYLRGQSAWWSRNAQTTILERLYEKESAESIDRSGIAFEKNEDERARRRHFLAHLPRGAHRGPRRRRRALRNWRALRGGRGAGLAGRAPRRPGAVAGRGPLAASGLPPPPAWAACGPATKRGRWRRSRRRPPWSCPRGDGAADAVRAPTSGGAARSWSRSPGAAVSPSAFGTWVMVWTSPARRLGITSAPPSSRWRGVAAG
ncbi:unnamed protein product [Prorocentrum cordatum]|uniref:Uncharacterized protein n=1 Tax=Prorocentrum cordatum TaxID=2364126 RepID=A0ABN9QF75_9DINO|nr:unnamed protein product [Polarella glacialis]